jgi:hypothetical protein
MDWSLFTSLTYAAVGIALTVWIGKTLYRHGSVFLIDVLDGREDLAHSVNRLLVVGFQLLGLGLVALNLVSVSVGSASEAVEELSFKVGAMLLVFGGMHLVNVLVLSRIRRRAAATHYAVADARR